MTNRHIIYIILRAFEKATKTLIEPKKRVSSESVSFPVYHSKTSPPTDVAFHTSLYVESLKWSVFKQVTFEANVFGNPLRKNDKNPLFPLPQKFPSSP